MSMSSPEGAQMFLDLVHGPFCHDEKCDDQRNQKKERVHNEAKPDGDSGDHGDFSRFYQWDFVLHTYFLSR